MAQNILVIKLSALGDFMTALGPMRAIRDKHKDDRLTLLTTKAFAEIARASNYFDEILLDEKPRWINPSGWMNLRRKLNSGKFARVYDLQNSDRTAFYLRLFSPRPEWVGAAPGASHRNDSPERTRGHAFLGHQQTLALAGITEIKVDKLDWMQGDLTKFALKKPYALLVPGCSPLHPEKRWSPASYRAIATALLQKNIQPVVLGTSAEAEVNREIASMPGVLDLTGQTSLFEIAALARGATGAVGNDTGPSHIIALTGCPLVMLFSTKSSTILKHGPLGENAHPLEAADLGSIAPAQVLDVWERIAGKNI
jgi:ADP-heptose:LPS heptosyltransferase